MASLMMVVVEDVFFFTQQETEYDNDAYSDSTGDTAATAEEDAGTKMTEDMGWGGRRRRKFGNPYWHGGPYGHHFGGRRRKYGNPFWHGSPHGHGYGGSPYWHGSPYGNPYNNHHSDGRRRRFFLTQQEAKGSSDGSSDASLEVLEHANEGEDIVEM